VDHSVEMMVSASREAFPVSLRRSFDFLFPLLAMFSHVYCGRRFSSPRRGVGINNKPLPRFGSMTIALSLPSYYFVWGAVPCEGLTRLFSGKFESTLVSSKQIHLSAPVAGDLSSL
jgi:hypothetical protein